MQREPHGRDIPVSAPTFQPLGIRGMIVAVVRVLHRWWAAERHYRPERRYMRGGQSGDTRALARR